MSLVVDRETFAIKSRVALVRVLNLNLRLLEEWRRAQGHLFGAPLDIETTLILMAVVVVGTENLVRKGDLAEFEDLSMPLEPVSLRKCTLSSIAKTTGLNREMVRRKVQRLERQGVLIRAEDGGVRMADDILARSAVSEAVESQLVAMAAALDQLVKDKLLRASVYELTSSVFHP